MKKNQLAAIIVGAVLITGSTISISAASMGKAHHKAHSSKAGQDSAFLRGVTPGNSWAALNSVLNPKGKKESGEMPTTILPSDTSTATMPSGEDGIDEENGTNNEVADLNDDDASPALAIPSATPPATTPTTPPGIPNPMTAPKNGSHDDAGQSSDNSDD